MPITRDLRNDRRRRMLRESLPKEPVKRRRAKPAEEPKESAFPSKRQPSYSQDVRKACGVRLVQLIPVRKTSYLAVVLASLAIPGTLLGLHYPIFVSGAWEWYGHPLVASLDVADNSRSILSWLNSQLWMFCLGATVLTFQLRKHRLDDFDGEYRLWFWMILTCLFGSINSTTQISDLFGLALNRWSQEQIGWSGPAVVHSTIAVLIGILGLRICTELKEVPSSVVFWLVGLVAWACSAALAQDAFKIDLSIQHRVWLKAVFWSGGLTCIWLAALGNLRHVYIVAQKRFLARGRMARLEERKPLRQRMSESGQRIRESIPTWRRGEDNNEADSEQRGGWLSRFRRDSDETEDGLSRAEAREAAREAKRKQKQELADLREMEKQEKREASEKRRAAKKAERESQRSPGEAEDVASERKSWLGFFKRSENDDEAVENLAQAAEENRGRPRQEMQDKDGEAEANGSRFGSLKGWLRKPKDDDEPSEYRKVRRNSNSDTQEDDTDEEGGKRSWFSWGRNRSEEADESGPSEPKKRQGLLARFKLQPPEEDIEDAPLPPVDQSRPLPTTGSNADSSPPSEDGGNRTRPLSRAEKKRMRRQRRNAA